MASISGSRKSRYRWRKRQRTSTSAGEAEFVAAAGAEDVEEAAAAGVAGSVMRATALRSKRGRRLRLLDAAYPGCAQTGAVVELQVAFPFGRMTVEHSRTSSTKAPLLSALCAGVGRELAASSLRLSAAAQRPSKSGRRSTPVQTTHARPYSSRRSPTSASASSSSSCELGFVAASGSEAGDLCARVGGHPGGPAALRHGRCWNLNASGAIFLAQPIWDSAGCLLHGMGCSMGMGMGCSCYCVDEEERSQPTQLTPSLINGRVRGGCTIHGSESHTLLLRRFSLITPRHGM